MGSGKSGARDIIIKSVCKAGCPRPLHWLAGPMPETCRIVCQSQSLLFTWAPSRQVLSSPSSRSPFPGGTTSLSLPSSTLSRMKYVHRSLSLPPVLSVSPSRIELRVDDHWEVILPSRRRDESKLLPPPHVGPLRSLDATLSRQKMKERMREREGDGRRHYVGLGHHYYGRAAQRERALSRRSWRWDLEKGRAGGERGI